VATWDTETRDALEMLGGIVDTAAALEAWEAAARAPHDTPPVWVHGDVVGANLLTVAGRLAAVIDFGCSAVGDPACDTTAAWTLFSGASRERFMRALPVDESTWARGRGWALWKALRELVHDVEHPGYAARAARRCGWRHTAQQVVEAVIEDHRQRG
jgi:aminoglycoside phosphotransferase (APT) family kinase protein